MVFTTRPHPASGTSGKGLHLQRSRAIDIQRHAGEAAAPGEGTPGKSSSTNVDYLKVN